MNGLNPENVVFVPKSRTKHCLLSCLTSLIILLVGIIVIILTYSFINY